ncbi:helix-turn-helix transcriptional regulator [Streptomyces sp. DSM 15324]|uniref:helix-turn-helix domain-containing protein n=1 Tax=unclassified Streptomyces TaxID=2593676 RepID=UPI00099F368D|nr:helix-turn-helix transcriptional regulator [Streptomyces sp. DSM 15324]
MKWNLRWVAARQDIWRPTDLLVAFRRVGFHPSLSKVSALWGGTPVTVRLEDLDLICQALGCTVADLLEAEPAATGAGEAGVITRAAAGEEGGSGPVRPMPRRDGPRRLQPPN